MAARLAYEVILYLNLFLIEREKGYAGEFVERDAQGPRLVPGLEPADRSRSLAERRLANYSIIDKLKAYEAGRDRA